MVLLLSVSRIAFPSLLAADCTMIFSVLLVADQCLSAIEVHTMMLWSLLISFGTTSFQLIFLFLSVPSSAMISMLDSLHNPDISRTVRAHLFEVRDFIVLLRQFLLSDL